LNIAKSKPNQIATPAKKYRSKKADINLITLALVGWEV